MPESAVSREDIKSIVEEVVRAVVPGIVREAMRDELELVGIDSTDASTRVEARKDFEFNRRLRTAWDGAARKVGNVVLVAALVGIGGLVALGLGLQAKGLK